MIVPEATLPKDLLTILDRRPAPLAERLRERARDLRPMVQVLSSRSGSGPLEPGLLGRLLGSKAASHKLSVLSSKWGGTPYYEEPAARCPGFVGQINFEEVQESLRASGAPLPQGLPERGILAIDLDPSGSSAQGFTVRWYEHPSPERFVAQSSCRQVARYEAGLRFIGGWSLRGLEWFKGIPDDDDELFEAWNNLVISGVDEDLSGPEGERHRLFGHLPDALNEHYGFTPAPGRGEDLGEYELLLRITYDRAAGLDWGTNWVHVLLHREDLREGRLERAVIVGTNA